MKRGVFSIVFILFFLKKFSIVNEIQKLIADLSIINVFVIYILIRKILFIILQKFFTNTLYIKMKKVKLFE